MYMKEEEVINFGGHDWKWRHEPFVPVRACSSVDLPREQVRGVILERNVRSTYPAKSNIWEHFGFLGTEDGIIADRNVAINHTIWNNTPSWTCRRPTSSRSFHVLHMESHIPVFPFQFLQYKHYYCLCNISIHQSKCIEIILHYSVLQYRCISIELYPSYNYHTPLVSKICVNSLRLKTQTSHGMLTFSGPWSAHSII